MKPRQHLLLILMVPILPVFALIGAAAPCSAAPTDSSLQGQPPISASPPQTEGSAPGDLVDELPRLNPLVDGKLGDLKTRPFRYWRMWANRPVQFFPALAFCLLTSATAWLLLPGTLQEGRSSCRASFWKSLLTGAVTLVLCAVFARFLFRSEIGFPLAVLVVALLELGLVLGFAVASALVGESVLARVKLSSSQWLQARPTAKRLLEVVSGAGLICILLLIPGIGGLPRIGTRLVMLLAFLGLGGLIRSSLVRRK